MKALALLLEDPAFRRLGWALAAFLWQGTLVAAILFCVNALLFRKDSRARYAAGCAALLVMLLLPAVTFLGRLGAVAPPAEALGASPARAEAFARWLAANRVTAGATPESGRIARAFQASSAWLAPWIVPAWLCGVLLLSARFLAGWNAARRLRLKGVRPAPAALRAALERLRGRLGVDRRVLLLESVRVNVPTALGVLRPAILLPVCAVTGLSPEAIEAVLAHELAHIRRHDYLVNLLQTAAETLLFYHPAVWWVSRRIRIERENCCDDLAVAATGDTRGYVRALVVLEEIRAPRLAAPGPAMAADGGSLWRRVARLMPASSSSRSVAEDAPRWVAGLLALAMVATVGAAARTSLFEESPVSPAVPAILPVSPESPVSPADVTSGAPAAPGEAAKAPRPPKEPFVPAPGRVAPVSGVAGGIAGGLAEGVSEGVEEGVGGGVSGGVAGDIEEDGEEGNTASARREGGLAPEDLANLRRHGVTPEFLDALAALGYKRASVNDLLALKIHGVTPEYISEMTALVGKQSLDELVSLRIHGVTPDFVRDLHSLGFTGLSADDAVACRIHGVTPDFVKEIQSLGYARPSIDELTALRIHGATPGFIRKANASAGARLSIDELVSRRIHGRNP